MSKIYYLQLTGSDSYGSPTIGSLVRGQSIGVKNPALAEKLLSKGTYNEDGSLNAFFTQVSFEQASGKVISELGAKRSRLNDSLAQVAEPAPAAPAEDNSGEVVAQEKEQGTESEEKQESEEGQTKVTRGRGRKASA